MMRQAVLALIDVFGGESDVLADLTRQQGHAGRHQTAGSETEAALVEQKHEQHQTEEAAAG